MYNDAEDYNADCTIDDTDENLLYNAVKRIADIILSIAGLVILSPVFLITAIAIKVESPGGAIYSQYRVGMNERKFKM